jgi:hypothetical protein
MERDFRDEAEEAILDSRRNRLENELAKVLKDKSAMNQGIEFFKGMGEFVQSTGGGGLLNPLKQQFEEFIGDLGGGLAEAIGPAISNLTEAFAPLFESIGTMIGGILENIAVGIEPLMDHLTNPIFDTPSGQSFSTADFGALGLFPTLLGWPIGLAAVISSFFHAATPPQPGVP